MRPSRAGLAMMAALVVLPASSASAATGLHLARDVPSPRHVVAHAAATAKLPYEGGEVLHTNRTHLIFWRPDGSGLTFDPGYVSVVEGFMSNVAAASHSTSNVFSLTGQYTDAGGPATYASHYAGAVMDTDPLPPSECADADPGWTDCLTDGQLQSEIEQVIHSHGLVSGPNDIYFLLTPDRLGSCMDSDPADGCALGGPVNGYCGYHSYTPDGFVRYAVIPYNAVAGHCQSSNPRPNSSTADPALSTISHELNETVTDPYGDSWVDSSGNEDGDLCLTSYGPAVGGSGSRRYNQVIHGHHYYLQEEWSNASGACQQRAQPDQASFTVTRRDRSQHELTVVGSGIDPEGRIVSYKWLFGDGQTGVGRQVQHRFPHPGYFNVTVRVTDSWRNWAYYTRALRAR